MIFGKDKIELDCLKLENRSLKGKLETVELDFIKLEKEYYRVIDENKVLQAKVDSIKGNEPSSELAEVLNALLKMSEG
jgi:hypothetical protein